MKRTMRRSLQSGGVPFTLARRKRRRTRTEIVVLCDISGSVLRAADLMIEFLQALHEHTGRLRVFGFTNRTAELTGLLAGRPEGLAEVAAQAELDLHAFSDFGGACHDFLERFPGAVTRHTTLIVMGDGRNNYGDAMTWAFDDLARPARKVVWLVPEARERWNTGDSQLREYARRCDVMAECHTLERLLRGLQRA